MSIDLPPTQSYDPDETRPIKPVPRQATDPLSDTTVTDASFGVFAASGTGMVDGRRVLQHPLRVLCPSPMHSRVPCDLTIFGGSPERLRIVPRIPGCLVSPREGAIGAGGPVGPLAFSVLSLIHI